MENFTPFSALFGGMLIGTSATILLLFNGKVVGHYCQSVVFLRPAS